MKKRKILNGTTKWLAPLIAMAIVLPLAFHSCQQDELFDLNTVYEGGG